MSFSKADSAPFVGMDSVLSTQSRDDLTTISGSTLMKLPRAFDLYVVCRDKSHSTSPILSREGEVGVHDESVHKTTLRGHHCVALV